MIWVCTITFLHADSNFTSSTTTTTNNNNNNNSHHHHLHQYLFVLHAFIMTSYLILGATHSCRPWRNSNRWRNSFPPYSSVWSMVVWGWSCYWLIWLKRVQNDSSTWRNAKNVPPYWMTPAWANMTPCSLRWVGGQWVGKSRPINSPTQGKNDGRFKNMISYTFLWSVLGPHPLETHT